MLQMTGRLNSVKINNTSVSFYSHNSNRLPQNLNLLFVI